MFQELLDGIFDKIGENIPFGTQSSVAVFRVNSQRDTEADFFVDGYVQSSNATVDAEQDSNLRVDHDGEILFNISAKSADGNSAMKNVNLIARQVYEKMKGVNLGEFFRIRFSRFDADLQKAETVNDIGFATVIYRYRLTDEDGFDVDQDRPDSEIVTDLRIQNDA